MNTMIREKDGNCIIRCRIQPSASKNKIAGIYDNALKITLTAPPVDGKANKMLTQFMAKQLKLPKSKVSVIKGESSRSKTILCKDITEKQVRSLNLWTEEL